jgi:hypothetical protein
MVVGAMKKMEKSIIKNIPKKNEKSSEKSLMNTSWRWVA